MANPTIFTENGMNAVKEAICSVFANVQFKIGSIYHDAQILSAEILQDGRIEISLIFSLPSAGSVTVSSVRILDAENNVVAEKAESISFNADLGGAYYKFHFSVIETQR